MNKKELLNKCNAILNGKEELDKSFLINNVFINHPKWEIKKGVGIQDIVIKNNNYNQKGFYIIRKDNSTTDISYIKSISYPNKLTLIKNGLRNIIKPQILEFRKNIFKSSLVLCNLCKRTLKNDLDLHIDHDSPSFDEICNFYLSDKDLNKLFQSLKGFEDNEEFKSFEDIKIIQEFNELHKTKANLQPLCKNCNLTKPKK